MSEPNTGADLSASENFADFEASLDTPVVKTDAPPVKEETTDEAPADDAGAQDDQPKADEGDKPAPKPKQTAQQRIDELTWRANEAERREKAAQERLEAALAGKTPAPEPQARQEADGAPNPADYEYGDTDAAFIRDTARYETRQEIEAGRREDEAKRTMDAKLDTFNTRKTEAFKDGVPDGFTAFCALPKVPTALNDIILISEVGPQLAAHYGDNTAELQRLSDLAPHLQAYEIAKVEASLTPKATTQTPQPKVITDAPEPAQTLRGQGGRFKVDPATANFADFDKAY